MDIYSINGLVRLKHPNTGAILLEYDPADLPAPGSVPILLQTTSVTLHGESIPIALYLLPNGMLQVVAGDYIFSWTP